jgi:ABC-2 type transport system permease protein
LVAIAAALHLALCLVLSRAVVTALSAALRSRRGRDLRILLVALVGFLPQLLRFVTVPGAGPGDVGALRGTARVLGWFPSGWAARAMASSRAGDLLPAALEIGGLAATIGLLVWWWSATLDRISTTAEAGATAPRPARRAVEPLFGGGLGYLPRSRRGAVAAREVRYSWREPRRRVAVVSGMLLPFIVLAGVISRGGLHHHGVVYASLLVTFGVGNRALNHFGLDGAALWVHEAAGSDLRADLSGKNLSIVLTTLPVVAVTGVILAAVSGGWPELAVAMVLAVGAIGVQLGVGNVTSVRMPVAVPDNPGNLWSTSSGQGCIVGLLSLMALGVEGVLVAPVALVIALTPSTTARFGEAIVGLVYAGLLWWAGLALAETAGRGRGPELLEAVSPRRAA